jgi:transposase
MTQQDRDRLIALRKAKKGLISQRQAAEEMGQSERHVRRLLVKLKQKGDQAVIHALRGRRSNRKLDDKSRAKAVVILGQGLYRGFGPTLASEYLAKHHQITASRETVRTWMMEGKLWRAKRPHVEKIHPWRERRSRLGELVQWDTSEHAWLEDRGPKLYLISMIDDATSRIHARFVLHDSTAENMRLLWSYVELYGRPLGFYTDKASLFQTAPKIARDPKELPRDEREPLPPTQIGRALAELGIVWIGAHSPQAKGRVERSFQTAQDRLVKGLRVAGAQTLEQANVYLETEFIPWWNQTLAVVPASADDAHRPLAKEHSLPASLSYVETRQVGNGYTIQFDNRIYQIARQDIRAGLRRAPVRVELRLDGSMAIRFRNHYLAVTECAERPKAVAVSKKPAASKKAPRPKSQWMKNFHLTHADKAAFSVIPTSSAIRRAKPMR